MKLYKVRLSDSDVLRVEKIRPYSLWSEYLISNPQIHNINDEIRVNGYFSEPLQDGHSNCIIDVDFKGNNDSYRKLKELAIPYLRNLLIDEIV
jgi:WD40 repeat protein